MLKSNQLDNKLVLIKANQLEQLTRCTEAVLSAGGKPILVGSDINNLSKIVERIEKKYSKRLFFSEINNNEKAILKVKTEIYKKFKKYPDILINDSDIEFEPMEMDDNFKIELDKEIIEGWNKIIYEELTLTLFLIKIFGYLMAESNGGIILNILSDIYLNPKVRIINNMRRINDVASVAITNGLSGLTKYIATYWNEKGVRSNSLTIGPNKGNSYQLTGETQLVDQIPIGRLANSDEIQSAILFLLSDASSYMTGFNLVINGGRTCW